MTPAELLALVMSFKSWDVWVLIGVVAVFGALGGWAHKLAAPAEDQRRWSGFVVVGAVAALAVLFVFGPKDPVKLLALSIVAGYGGKAVLDALENKVKAAVAEAETKHAKEQGQQAAVAARKAIEAGRRLTGEVEERLAPTKGAHVPKPAGSDLAPLVDASRTAAETWDRLGAQLDLLETHFNR